MEKAVNNQAQSRTKEIVLCGLSIALMAVSAWITVPFGPIPFTLQTLAIMFVLFALTPKCALISIAGYLVLGAIGLPVFSSFKGGLAALLGPTGGFITGFLIAGGIALLAGSALKHFSLFTGESKKSFLWNPYQNRCIGNKYCDGRCLSGSAVRFWLVSVDDCGEFDSRSCFRCSSGSICFDRCN